MITRCRPLLGTLVEITVPDASAHAVDAAFDIIAHIHARMSFHERASDLARLRTARAGETVAVAPETVIVLRQAIAFHDASDGIFDVAVGRALVRGGFLPREGVHLRQFPGTTSDIEILDNRNLRCRRPMLIDLGGIAKGHAVDRAVEALASQGVREGLVNAGGDLRMFGDRDWTVQLRDADNLVRSAITARNCAIASSANLLERKKVRGRDHSPHIGRNGTPVLADRRVTVSAARCIVADAMTKVAMVDPDLANDILAAHNGSVLCDADLAAAA